GRTFQLGRYDSVYVPRGETIEVQPGPGGPHSGPHAGPHAGIDLAELSAPVAGRYPSAFVSHAEALRDPTLHFQTGGPGSSRDLCILIGKNGEAGGFPARPPVPEPGNPAPWPPPQAPRPRRGGDTAH